MNIEIIILVAAAVAVATDEDYYVLDKIDTNALMADIGEIKNFLDCITDRAPCKKEYQSYRDVAEEVIQQACKRCSIEQKILAWQFLELVKAKLPEYYNIMKNKFDPDNKYFNVLSGV